MGTSSRAPAELSRDELEEVARLQELEERIETLEALIGTLGDTSSKDASLKDITLAGEPAGMLIDKNTQRIKGLESVVEGDGSGHDQLGGNRDQMLPIHRMYGDLKLVLATP